MRQACKFAFRNRNFLVGIPLAFAFFSTSWETENELIVWIPAVLFCLAGIALRSWGVSYCNYAQGKRKTLAIAGPYRYVRNPLYWGNMMIVAGAGISSELVWLVPGLIAWSFLVYHAGVLHEETRLLKRYGQSFENYCRDVPRWFPHLGAPVFGTDGMPERSFLSVFRRQVLALLVLLPFAMKELELFGLWHHA